MHKLQTIAVGLALTLVAPLCCAHHGFAAHFDPDQLIRIEGAVKQFDFINPHGFLHIDSVNDAGEPVVYVVQPGDTLWAIAERFTPEGIDVRHTVDRLSDAAGGALLQPGQRIVLPLGD